mmetsp:Transcript_37310/g.120249  ORF Transcript_37310/g.120249 Transcript_37310/m.120249 type:complete len:280 (-) Transcript_37310:438-1277(-)
MGELRGSLADGRSAADREVRRALGEAGGAAPGDRRCHCVLRRQGVQHAGGQRAHVLAGVVVWLAHGAFDGPRRGADALRQRRLGALAGERERTRGGDDDVCERGAADRGPQAAAHGRQHVEPAAARRRRRRRRCPLHSRVAAAAAWLRGRLARDHGGRQRPQGAADRGCDDHALFFGRDRHRRLFWRRVAAAARGARHYNPRCPQRAGGVRGVGGARLARHVRPRRRPVVNSHVAAAAADGDRRLLLRLSVCAHPAGGARIRGGRDAVGGVARAGEGRD